MMVASPALHRWECHCSSTPVLLAKYTDDGRVEIAVRGGKQAWTIQGGTVEAICPRCGRRSKLIIEN